MDIGPACFGDDFETFPDSVAGMQIQAAEFAVAVYTVNVIPLKDGSGYAAMQAVSVSFAGALASPEFFDGELIGIQFQQE